MNGGSSAPCKRLAGKVAIITGGASGIGETTVKIFHENGAKVVIADIQDKLGQALADKLREGVCYIHCDVSNEDDVINLVDTTVSKYGKLDIMYSNAGIIDRTHGTILDTSKSDLERVLGVNTVGAFLAAKHAARVMVPQKKGCILFTASACTAIGGLGSIAYAVSKYGVVSLVKHLAAELGEHGIKVNCVSPYAVVTGISGVSVEDPSAMEAAVSKLSNLQGQVLKPEGIANAALYLASDEANYVNGVNLVVDGGFSTVNPSLIKAFSHAK